MPKMKVKTLAVALREHLSENSAKIKKNFEDGFLNAAKLCHRYAGLSEEESRQITEMERTSVKLFMADRMAEAQGSVPFDHFEAILDGHARDALKVFDLIGKNPEVDAIHNLKKSGKERFFTNLENVRSAIQKLRSQGFRGYSNLPVEMRDWVRIFNECAIRLHLGEEKYANYTRQRRVFDEEMRKMMGIVLN